MSFGPVGIRCPDHASATGTAPAAKRATRSAAASLSRRGPFVTQALIAVNVGIFVLELLLGGQLNGRGSWIYEQGVLVAQAMNGGLRLLTHDRPLLPFGDHVLIV